jgi:endoglucanase
MLAAGLGTKTIALFAVAALGMSVMVTPVLATSGTTSGRDLSPNTRFFVPTPDKGALTQIASLVKARNYADAYLVTQEVTTPQAVWFTSGTPASVKKAVQKTVLEASFQRAVPVMVLYNLPGRDCAQYSKGGALSLADY